MIKNRSLLFTAVLPIIFILPQSIKAQSNQWQLQKDDSLLKENYYKISADTTSFLIQHTDKKTRDDYKKIYNNRLEQIRDLLNGTRSITEPRANSYLTALVQKIIATNTELQQTKPRVLFTRDWWPNAFCLGEGTIVINAGLLLYLQSEAELAFVISHELAHLYLNHSGQSIVRYVETFNSSSFQSELERISKEQYMVNRQLERLTRSIVFNSRRHSRDYETEADKKAFEYVRKAGFNTNAVITTLLTLDRVDDSSVFQPLRLQQMLSFANYPFKPKWIQTETSIFSGVVEDSSKAGLEEKDSLKTHPDCIKRITLLGTIAIEGKDFLMDETLFRQLQNDFVKEITEQCFRSGNLSRNLYYSLLLLQEERFRPFAIYSAARCLNQIYEDQKNHKLGLKIDTESKLYSKDYNLLLRMLQRLKLSEAGLLALHFCNYYSASMKEYEVFNQEFEKAKQRNL